MIYDFCYNFVAVFQKIAKYIPLKVPTCKIQQSVSLHSSWSIFTPPPRSIASANERTTFENRWNSGAERSSKKQ